MIKRVAFFFFNDTATTEIYTLSLHDALPIWSMKAVAPHMIERRSGSMVLISSVNGVRGNAGAAHYAASKHGVLGLMRSAALELGPHRVRVNAICPGLVDTPMVNWPEDRKSTRLNSSH